MPTHPLLGLTASLACCLPAQRRLFLFEIKVSQLQNVSSLQPRFRYLKIGRKSQGFCDTLTLRANSVNCS